MMKFGTFECTKKSKTETKKDTSVEEKYKLEFKDEHDNKMVVVASEGDYDTYEVGMPLEWNMVIRQRKLNEQ